MLIIIYRYCYLGMAPLKRLGGGFECRQEYQEAEHQGESAPSLRGCREGSQKRSISPCTEVAEGGAGWRSG